MGEPYELKFAGLCAGGTAAHFLAADAITGGRFAHVEFYATRQNVETRYHTKLKSNEDAREEHRALSAFHAMMREE